jgi:insertion element IS1 protein InsB
VLAYVFGRRKDAVFLQMQALLDPFGITQYYTSEWGAYERHIDPEQHEVGKSIRRKLKASTSTIKRLVRRTMCFSKTTTMYLTVRSNWEGNPRWR